MLPGTLLEMIDELLSVQEVNHAVVASRFETSVHVSNGSEKAMSGPP